MATAWRASPVSSTRLAPTRSATSPQMILPLSEARPAALSTVAAAIAGTPWSIAWVTMWKIGPEPRRDERDREAAVPGEPAGGRRRQRRVQAARREPDDHAEVDLELAE